MAVNFTQVFVVVDEPPLVSSDELSSLEQEKEKIVTNRIKVTFKKM